MTAKGSSLGQLQDHLALLKVQADASGRQERVQVSRQVVQERDLEPGALREAFRRLLPPPRAGLGTRSHGGVDLPPCLEMAQMS